MVTPYQIDEADFPLTASAGEQFRFLLHYAILAPSTYNTQPWKFGLSDEGIAVYADYTRRMPVADPGNRELLMSLGAAIMNLRVAAVRFGFACRVDYNLVADSERPVAFARLTRGERVEGEEALCGLFPGILRRHTNRNPFLVSRIPSSVLAMVREAAIGSQVVVHISTDGHQNQRVGDLVAAAEQVFFADKEFRKDSAEWVRPSWTDRGDGVPGDALGMGPVATALAPWATRILDAGRVRAARDRNLCIEAPGLIVLAGEDGVPYHLETGEVLERILLTLARERLYTSYFNMLIKSPEFRVQLRTLLGLSSWPQLLLRIGYCLGEPSLTPRRPLEEVIIASPRY